MTELVFLGLNALLLVAAWRIVFKPALTDFVRDRLFDGRDELWQLYAARGQLDHPCHKHLRALYNHQLRFIEDQSLVRMLHFQAAIATDDATAKYISEIVSEHDRLCGEDSTGLLTRHRKRANRWLKFYLVHSSFCLASLFYVTFFTIMLSVLFGYLRRARLPERTRFRKTYVKRVDRSFDDKPLEGYVGTHSVMPATA